MTELHSEASRPAAIARLAKRLATAASWPSMDGRGALARRARFGGGLMVCLALCACAAGSAESQHAVDGGILAQLLLGFWHGLIGPVMLIIEIINRFAPHVLPWQNIRFYEAHGATVFYDIGFYLGLAGSPVLVGSRWGRRG